MKATGIVRRIDDLGRVVIPKEIRRTMRIREGDPLEIYTDRDGEVIFKKYSPIGELTSFSSQYAETLHKTGELLVAICDRDSVIACSGVPKKEFLEKRLSEQAEKVIESRSLYTYNPGDTPIELVSGGTGSYFVSSMMPIITEGDVVGCVAALRPTTEKTTYKPGEIETKLIQTAAGFLGKQLEQ